MTSPTLPRATCKLLDRVEQAPTVYHRVRADDVFCEEAPGGVGGDDTDAPHRVHREPVVQAVVTRGADGREIVVEAVGGGEAGERTRAHARVGRKVDLIVAGL